VQRITELFNFLSHENLCVSEQIAILLANISNSEFFQPIFISDRCMKSLLKILREHRNPKVARVSQLAALIVVLNLTALPDFSKGMVNMRFMDYMQDIIKAP